MNVLLTNDDGIDMDNTIYTLSIYPGNNTAAKNIKCISKIYNCSFIEAKEILLNGREIKGLNAIQTFDILKGLKTTDIHFTTTPKFNHTID